MWFPLRHFSPDTFTHTYFSKQLLLVKSWKHRPWTWKHENVDHENITKSPNITKESLNFCHVVTLLVLVLRLLRVIVSIVLKGMVSLVANVPTHSDFTEFTARVHVLRLIVYFTVPSFAPHWEMGMPVIQTEREGWSTDWITLVYSREWNSSGLVPIENCSLD